MKDWFTFVYKLCRKGSPPASSSVKDWLAIGSVISLWEGGGDVVEFGVYQGGTSAILSKICALRNRRLFLFDSFQGFPNLQEYSLGDEVLQDRHTALPYRASIERAKQTVEKYGEPDVVTWVPGFFSETLPKQVEPEKICVAYVDVDLPLSQKEAYEWIWPRLIPGGFFFTHEVPTALKHKTYDLTNLQVLSRSMGVIQKKVS